MFWDRTFNWLAMVPITLKQTAMSFGTNLTRKAQRDPPLVLLTVPQLRAARSRFVGSVIFCFDIQISLLKGKPRTPPGGDNLGVLDYHLNTNLQQVILPV